MKPSQKFPLNFSLRKFVFQEFKKISRKRTVFYENILIITYSYHMRRYWFYVKNNFRNFHQIFRF